MALLELLFPSTLSRSPAVAVSLPRYRSPYGFGNLDTYPPQTSHYRRRKGTFLEESPCYFALQLDVWLTASRASQATQFLAATLPLISASPLLPCPSASARIRVRPSRRGAFPPALSPASARDSKT